MNEGGARVVLDRRRAVGVATVVLVVAGLSAYVRFQGWDDIPVKRDWAWFLRSATAHALGESPRSNHAFLYTSIPVVGFGRLLPVLGLHGALVLWSALAALAAPLTALAVVVHSRRRWVDVGVAALAGTVVAVSTTDIGFGRGLESPYLATTLVAAGACLLPRRSTPTGIAALAFVWSLAAGMHLGLAGLSLWLVSATLWEAGAESARRGGVRYGGVLLAALCVGLLPASVVVFMFDVNRLLSDILMLSHGAGSGYAGEPPTTGAQLATFGLLPATAIGVFGVASVGAGVAWRRGAKWTSGGASVGLALLFGVAPYALGFLATGYLSDDHSAALLPLLLVVACRISGVTTPLVAALWLIQPITGFLEQPPERAEGVGLADFATARTVARDVGGAIDLRASSVFVFVPRDLEGGIPSALSAEVLTELLQAERPARGRVDTCLVVMPERRLSPPDLRRIPSPELRKQFRLDLFEDPGCATLDRDMSWLCAQVPGGFHERTHPRGDAPRRAYAFRPGSCIAPIGMQPDPAAASRRP